MAAQKGTDLFLKPHLLHHAFHPDFIQNLKARLTATKLGRLGSPRQPWRVRTGLRALPARRSEWRRAARSGLPGSLWLGQAGARKTFPGPSDSRDSPAAPETLAPVSPGTRPLHAGTRASRLAPLLPPRGARSQPVPDIANAQVVAQSRPGSLTSVQAILCARPLPGSRRSSPRQQRTGSGCLNSPSMRCSGCPDTGQGRFCPGAGRESPPRCSPSDQTRAR